MVKGRMLSFKVEATVILEAGDGYNVRRGRQRWTPVLSYA